MSTRGSGEPPGWTVETLRQHVEVLLDNRTRLTDQRFADAEKAVAAALASAEKAVDAALSSAKEAVLKAERADEARFENLNGTRALLEDVTGRLMPRAETLTLTQSLRDKLDDTNEALSKLTERVTDLSARLEGRSAGLSSGWNIMINVLVVVLAVVTIVMTR